DVDSRTELQKYALAFEQRLLALKEISGVEKQGYLRPEIQILIHPQKLKEYDISLAEVRNQITTHHVRMPVGSMEDRNETEISVLSELEDVDGLKNLVVRGGFEGQHLKLGQIATVRHGFERNKTILKTQGHE